MTYKLSIIFTKKGVLRFISHLDLARVFQRAVYRQGIPICLSEGFKRRPKISFKRALKLGVESDHEEAVFQLKENMPADEFKSRLQAELPDGITIKDCILQV